MMSTMTSSSWLRLRARWSSAPKTLVNIGCDLADRGDNVGARNCFERASHQGDAVAAFNLGNCLTEQGLLTEAVASYTVAIERGETGAWLNLGNVLGELGDLAGQMRAYEEAERAGDSTAAVMLAFALREQGDRAGALAAALRSSDAGNSRGAAVVACWQWCETLDPALEPALRAGAEIYPSARADLGDLLVTTGRIEEGRQTYVRGVALGEVESAVPLGNLYADLLGDTTAAEAAYRDGCALGDPHAHHNLAAFLEARGDTSAAAHHYRLAAAGGDTLAGTALRNLSEE